VRVLVGHKKDVRAVAYAPDGRLVSGGGDRTVRVWDPLTGACLTTIKAAGPVYAVAVAPDGGTLAYAGRPPPREVASNVRVRDLAGKLVAEYAVQSEKSFVEQIPGTWEFRRETRSVGYSIWSLAFSDGGHYLAAASRRLGGGNWPNGAGGRVWDRTTPYEVRLPGNDAYTLTFAPAGHRLAVTRRSEVQFFDVPRLDDIVAYPLPSDWAAAVAFVPGADLAVVGQNGFLFFVNPVRSEKPKKLKTGLRNVTALAVSPDGSTLLAGGKPGTVEVYDMPSRTRTRVYDFPVGGVHAVAFAPDGLTFAVAGDQGLVVADAGG
jgi:WD40 repeat protein